MAAQSRSASPERRRRVVVTGIGPVTPIGAGVEAFWDALLAGRSGITPIEHVDASQLPVKIAGEIHDFDPEAWIVYEIGCAVKRSGVEPLVRRMKACPLDASASTAASAPAALNARAVRPQVARFTCAPPGGPSP